MNEVKSYHYLVVGNVIIEVEGNIQAVPQNAMILTDQPEIGVHQLGKAQQALQLTLQKKLGEMPNVVDVIITNLVMLGFMTSEQFNHRPEGLQVQERAKEEPASNVVDFSEALNDRV